MRLVALLFRVVHVVVAGVIVGIVLFVSMGALIVLTGVLVAAGLVGALIAIAEGVGTALGRRDKR